MSCNCGCGGCQTKNQGPLLTEGKVKSLLSEGLKFHIDKQIPLFESIYRIGSDSHLSMIKEARKLYSRGLIDLNEQDEALMETHLGEFALYEGESVPLDLPMLNEELSENKPSQEKVDKFFSDTQQEIHYLNSKPVKDWDEYDMSNWKAKLKKKEQGRPQFGESLNKELDEAEFKGVEVPLDLPMIYEGPYFGILYHFTQDLIQVISDNTLRSPISFTRSLDSHVSNWLGDQPLLVLDKDKLRTKYKIRPYKDNTEDDDFEDISQYDEMEEVIDRDVTNLDKYLIKVILPHPDENWEEALKEKNIPYEYKKSSVKENKKKKKDPPIGKPKRGGSKAYYVYVRDPKTKKVKKVSFGSGGLRAKIKNKEARNAFAARHKCKDKKDRTKAGYWSCNLPRYAKALGLGANMNTFW